LTNDLADPRQEKGAGMKYQDMSMNTAANPEPQAPMNTNKGKDPGVKRLEKHSLKSGFFTKKGMKGDC